MIELGLKEEAVVRLCKLGYVSRSGKPVGKRLRFVCDSSVWRRLWNVHLGVGFAIYVERIFRPNVGLNFPQGPSYGFHAPARPIV